MIGESQPINGFDSTACRLYLNCRTKYNLVLNILSVIDRSHLRFESQLYHHDIESLNQTDANIIDKNVWIG